MFETGLKPNSQILEKNFRFNALFYSVTHAWNNSPTVQIQVWRKYQLSLIILVIMDNKQPNNGRYGNKS